MNVYITLHAKDTTVLPYCVRGIRACPDVSGVIVIASAKCAPLCRSLGVNWIDEDRVVPGVRHDTYAATRWGWYFQQILKLGVAWLEREDYYLVVDADTVFLNPVRFFSDEGQPIYTTARESHAPYFETFERLLGFSPQRGASFIAHHMVFRCDRVREMCAAFRPDPVWWRNIADCLEPRPPQFSLSQFSEYEMYGHYIQNMHSSELIRRSLRWRNIAEPPSRRRVKRFTKDFDFISFQEYLRTERRLSRPWRVFLSKIKRRALQFCKRGSKNG